MVSPIKNKETFIGTVKICTDSDFHGIDCITNGEEYGFVGCYNEDINHPDPRPGHRIWLKKLYAEKLFNLFSKKGKDIREKEILEIIRKCDVNTNIEDFRYEIEQQIKELK